MKIGTLVRILQPDYAQGLLGTVEGYESECDRWIIKLERESLRNRDELVRLSLEKTDFEISS